MPVDLGIGDVLMQNEQPVAFLSKALGPTQQKLSIYEKEFLALIMAVEKWRQYLQRHEFVIRTDHKSLAEFTLGDAKKSYDSINGITIQSCL